MSFIKHIAKKITSFLNGMPVKDANLAINPVKQFKSTSDKTLDTISKLNASGEPIQQPVNIDLSSKTDVRWITPENNITISGFTISGGYLYVDSRLLTNKELCLLNEEPSFINKNFLVAKYNPDTKGEKMCYWPSYSEIEPECRLAYLQWLANGKKNPNISIGYVFLYFYGIERRIIIDMPYSNEILSLIEEIKKLRSIYATNNSFNGYSERLLEAANLIIQFRDLENMQHVLPSIENHTETDHRTQIIALAYQIHNNSILSFEWAMVACLYVIGWHQKVIVKRAHHIFIALMRKKFEKKWPQGLKLQQCKTKFSYPYHGAALSLQIDLAEQLGLNNFPSPQSYNWNKLIKLADEVGNSITPYSRALGRNASPLKATLLLPSQIITEQLKKITSISWLNEIVNSVDCINIVDLIEGLFGEKHQKLNKRALHDVANIMAHLGYGIEPDPEFGDIRSNLNGVCVIFDASDIKNPRKAVGKEYIVAQASIVLIICILRSTNEVFTDNTNIFFSKIKSFFKLSEHEYRRLSAYFKWLCQQKITMTQIRHAFSKVSKDQFYIIASFATEISINSSAIEKIKMEFLEKIFDELNIDRKKLYGLLHDIAVKNTNPATDLVLVKKQKNAVNEKYKINFSPDLLFDNTKKQELDEKRVSEIVVETERISEVLKDIFNESINDSNMESHVNKEENTENKYSQFSGLDHKHTNLVKRLSSKKIWRCSDLEVIADELELMPNGALEVINDWAFDRFGEAFAEVSEEIEINCVVIKQIGKNEVV